MPPKPTLPLFIDSTMRSCFVSCPRKFYNEFILCLSPPGLSIDLHAGGCFSTALETVYKRVWRDKLSFDAALLQGEAAFELAWGDFEIPEWKKTTKTKDRVWLAVEDYFAQYPPLSDYVQPFFDSNGSPTFEYSFAIPLEPAVEPHMMGPGLFPLHPSGSPWLYTGRFDKLGTIAGRPVVCDEKTTGKVFSQFWSDSFSLRGQFIGYVWACQQCGIDVQSVVVRGVKILKEKPTDFAEVEKHFSDHLISRWLEQLRRDLWRLRFAWDTGYWDYNFGETCTSFGNCSFMDLCTASDPEPYYSTFGTRNWDPLSKNPAQDPTT